MIKKFFNDWNLFEKLLLIFSVISISLIGVYFKSDLLTTISSIVGIMTGLFLAKGKNLGQIFGLLITLLYSIVSFNNRFYGEVIIYVCMMLPMYIVGIISWIRHRNKETNFVEINKVDKNELIIFSIVSIGIFIIMYNLLKFFNTNELLLSTISVNASLFAMYLQIRRSRFSFAFYIVNDVILFCLWIFPVINGNLLVLPMVFDPIFNFINDSYGLYNWKKIEKLQNSL